MCSANHFSFFSLLLPYFIPSSSPPHSLSIYGVSCHPSLRVPLSPSISPRSIPTPLFSLQFNALMPLRASLYLHSCLSQHPPTLFPVPPNVPLPSCTSHPVFPYPHSLYPFYSHSYPSHRPPCLILYPSIPFPSLLFLSETLQLSYKVLPASPFLLPSFSRLFQHPVPPILIPVPPTPCLPDVEECGAMDQSSVTPPYTMDNIQPRVPGVLVLVVVGPGEWDTSSVEKSGSWEENGM